MKIKTNGLVCLLDRQDVFVFNVVCSFWWRCPNIKCTYFIFFFFFSNNSLAQSQMFSILFLIIIISWQSAAKKIKCGNVLKCVVISNYNVFWAEYSTQWIKLAELIVMLEKSCLIVKNKTCNMNFEAFPRNEFLNLLCFLLSTKLFFFSESSVFIQIAEALCRMYHLSGRES